MLRYLNKGLRYYGTRDVHPPDHCRNNWEVLIVSQGTARPLIQAERSVPLAAQTLWLLPPDSRHCWESPKHAPCYVHVFHFASIHPLVRNLLARRRVLAVPLSAKDLQETEEIYRSIEGDYARPTAVSEVRYEIAMLRLAELILRNAAADLVDFDADGERVVQAMHWFREHMAEGANVSDVSAALRVSAAHLRRLFLRIRQESPNRAFARAKTEEACRLMSTTNLSMKEVAARCGFRGFSEFYRFFARQTGQPPTTWKSNVFYREARSASSETPAPPEKPSRRTR